LHYAFDRKIAAKSNKKKTAKSRTSDLLDQAIAKFETKLRTKDFSPTVGDYLKLMQLKKELDEEEEDAKEIKVTWVDPEGSEN